MLIGIISDSHDNIWNLEKALKMLKDKKVAKILHCGDFCAPFILAQLADSNFDIHLVWGNTNDKEQTEAIAEKAENLTLHGDVGELTLENKRIAFTHFPQKAEELAGSNKYDIIFYGHTHRKDDRKINKTRLINPGEIMGRLGKATFAVYDTKTDTVEFFNI